MNIFFLSLCVKECASFYFDKHVGKILLEIAQMLSTGVRVLSPSFDESRIYKRTHINHPMCRWVRACAENWQWTLSLGTALHEEWLRRYGKPHKSYQTVSYIASLSIPLPSNGGLSSIPLCMPDECKAKDVVSSYREYYKTKKGMASWKTKVPEWWS